ncbi:MAG: hypothetical protein HFG28_09495 [Eubacterium sp.]|nr:hypothetical protein [Eubacterium sp.]
MRNKTQNNQTMEQTEQANKGKETLALDFITCRIKGKFFMLPQFIHSSDEKFNETIRLELSLDDFYSYGDIFSQETEKVIKIMHSYFRLIDKSCEDAGVNLMTMLFQIYHETGKLKDEYYLALNKMLAEGNYSAPYFIALDWIVGGSLKRGYDLMLTLDSREDVFAKLFFEDYLKHEFLEDTSAALQ